MKEFKAGIVQSKAIAHHLMQEPVNNLDENVRLCAAVDLRNINSRRRDCPKVCVYPNMIDMDNTTIEHYDWDVVYLTVIHRQALHVNDDKVANVRSKTVLEA